MPTQPAHSLRRTAGHRDEVQLTLDCDTAKPGEMLTGRVRLRGHSHLETLVNVHVMLFSKVVAKGWQQYAKRSWIAELIPAKELTPLEFSLEVSEEQAFGLESLLRLLVGEHNVVIDMEVKVPLAACYQQLADCLANVARVSVTEWTYAARGDGIAARLEPTGAARDLFDELQLEIYRSGPYLYGDLVIDPRERTLADRLKASVGADRRRYPFRFQAATDDEVRHFFEQCLRPYLDAIRHLPIPAAVPPQDPACLPRPSDHGAEAPE